MNPGDKKRLEVADRMRRVQGICDSAVPGIHWAWIYGVLDELASLIDRGTCHNVYNENELPSCRNGFECDVCGNRVEDLEHCAITGKFEYCPGCGRIVVP